MVRLVYVLILFQFIVRCSAKTFNVIAHEDPTPDDPEYSSVRASIAKTFNVIAHEDPTPDDPEYSSVRASIGTSHYFDIKLNTFEGQIVYKVYSMIEWNETFTVSVYFTPRIYFVAVDKIHIKCSNSKRLSEVYFNQTMNETMASSKIIYVGKVSAFSREIAPIWGCEIFSTPKLHWKISFKCTVTFKPPPPADPPKPGDGNLSVTPHPPQPSSPENPRSSILIISGAAVAMVMVIALAIVGLIKCWKASARKADAGAADGNGDPVYESVDYTACGQPGTEATASINIASRPPCPLPPEDEGNEKYVHYDTVYEERLQRMMMMYHLRRQARKPCSRHVGRTCAQ